MHGLAGAEYAFVTAVYAIIRLISSRLLLNSTLGEIS